MSFVLHRAVDGQTRLTGVDRPLLRIGRGADADLRIDDDAVALDHARIEVLSSKTGPVGWLLTDRGSVTGTYLNGRPVTRAELSAGDVIEIGGCRITVQVTHPEDPLFLHLELPAAAPKWDLVPQPPKESADRGERDETRPVPIPSPAESEPAARTEPDRTPDPHPAPRSAEVSVPPPRVQTAPGARPETGDGGGAVTEPTALPAPIDYARAYSLARPGLTKASLTLALSLLTTLLLLGGIAAGAHRLFMPGISSAHARIVGAAPASSDAVRAGAEGGEVSLRSDLSTGEARAERSAGGGSRPPRDTPRSASSPADGAPLDPRAARAAKLGCLACHRPWRGPVDTGCAECHTPQTAPHAPRQAAAPACSTCHPEHRPAQPLIATAEGTGCVSCHRSLEVASGEPRVAADITSFATDHPELVVTPRFATPASDDQTITGPAFSLADPAARRGDPGRLAFNHRVHLAAGLRGSAGPVQLACDDCHTVVDDSGRMAPITFAEHCQSCHRLTFDAVFPDREAPHASPQEVEDFLVGLYSRADRGAAAGGSLRQRRLGIIRGGGRRRLPAGVDRQVADAGRTLFRSQCAVCHQMDLDATPLPTVEPPRLPVAWLARARFSHLDHPEVACGECHLGVARSAATADVLLPGIAQCRQCHGGGNGTGARSASWGGLLGCAQCHSYHPPRVPAARVAELTPPVTESSVISTISMIQPQKGRR